jgi:hypothetical protein
MYMQIGCWLVWAREEKCGKAVAVGVVGSMSGRGRGRTELGQRRGSGDGAGFC